MNQLTSLIMGVISLSIGSILGYYARQSIAKRDWKTIESKIQKRIQKARKESKQILSRAQQKASQILEKTKEEGEEKRKHLFKTEQLLSRRENLLDKKLSELEEKQKDFQEKVKKLKQIKSSLEKAKNRTIKELERVAGLNEREAREELFKNIESKYQADALKKIEAIEKEGYERFEKKAQEMLATAIQKYALPQCQEITTSTISLPNEDIKGRIIGKDGRNIRAFERLTGVEVIVDETPETVALSAFNPVRREIASVALKKLIQDGRIQPARIEEKVEEARKEINKQIQKAGKTAAYEVGFPGLEPKLIQLLGRLKFRTSYGQNVLLHSIEVAYLASFLAEEIGANSTVCKKAGLLHDIGKAVDHQIEGSHVDIGIKILEKFGVEKEVIRAMESHHGEYPFQSLEAILVQVADQISGSRPGARKDTLEDYLKRLSNLEDIAVSFPGVKKAWALQAGREIRVFVRPDQIDDLEAKRTARGIAQKIQQELRYPGEIKVTVIREKRIVEYAK